MPKLKPGTVLTTDEEDRRIKEGIAADPDTFEMPDEMAANARPASEVHPEIVQWYKRTRGKQKKPACFISRLTLVQKVTHRVAKNVLVQVL